MWGKRESRAGPALCVCVMGGDLWTRHSSVNGTIWVSFVLGCSGAIVGIATGHYALREAMTRQMGSLQEAVIHMRKRLEVSGGVPYLLRDEVRARRGGVGREKAEFFFLQ